MRNAIFMKQGFGFRRWLLLGPLLLSLFGCGTLSREKAAPAAPLADVGQELPMLGHSIQVGAFASLENAVRLMGKLDTMGLDSYYYRHADGLYKVRFGDYPTGKAARMSALKLRNAGIIGDFYVVTPADYAAARLRQYRGGEALRNMLVGTAEEFLGIPYQWGGESVGTGFDCSGLAMTVYKMNGLKLPRNSRSQYGAGIPVRREDLRPGDLVFFATNGGSEVSHVGIYTGDDRFIHAPRRGTTICQSSLSDSYFSGCYIGARTYLRDRS
ncbi:NlpC/P60 family protein [Thiovibrio sp. JS02]